MEQVKLVILRRRQNYIAARIEPVVRLLTYRPPPLFAAGESCTLPLLPSSLATAVRLGRVVHSLDEARAEFADVSEYATVPAWWLAGTDWHCVPIAECMLRAS